MHGALAGHAAAPSSMQACGKIRGVGSLRQAHAGRQLLRAARNGSRVRAFFNFNKGSGEEAGGCPQRLGLGLPSCPAAPPR